MAGLLIISLASWTVIFGKLFGLRRVRSGNEEFERDFWSGRNLNDLNRRPRTSPPTAPMERIFASGMREFLKLRERRMDAGAQLDGARRAMRASFQREMDVVESNLCFLASVGSVSALCRPVRHGVGDHARLRRPVQPAAGDAGHGGAGHRRGAGGHRHRPVRGDPRGGGLQPLRARHRPHRDPARDLHRGVLQHPAAQRRRRPPAPPPARAELACRRRQARPARPPHDERDQHGARSST